MQFTRLLAAVAALGLAAVCSASDKWDAQDPASWSQDTIHKLTHDSPWAHMGKVTIEANQGGMGSQGGRGGGQYPNDPNDPNSGGYPGNSRRGGVYLPGIGLPFPGGGGMGYPGGRGRGRGGNRRPASTTSSAVVRWDSALPLRLAYSLQDPGARSDSAEVAKTPGWRKADEEPASATPAKTADAAAPEKAAETALSPSQTPAEYIIAVDGFPLNTGNSQYQRQRQGSDTSRTGGQTSDQDDNRNSQYGGRDPEAIREELMERTTISRGTGRSLRPVKVEFDLPGKLGIVYFHFSRDEAITLKDKELDFQTQLGGNRLERKFETKEMVYKGKLEL